MGTLSVVPFVISSSPYNGSVFSALTVLDERYKQQPVCKKLNDVVLA